MTGEPERGFPALPCPYFMPTHKSEDAAWLHPTRLPLGAGWNGLCCAPGHEGVTPSGQSLAEHCNLGYATTCPNLPEDRAADAVRFSVVRDRGSQLELWFILERNHCPAGHGKLAYDAARAQWQSPHPDAGVQKMAQCYVESYLQRRLPSTAQPMTAQPSPIA
jgi:hypothetical protein